MVDWRPGPLAGVRLKFVKESEESGYRIVSSCYLFGAGGKTLSGRQLDGGGRRGRGAIRKVKPKKKLTGENISERFEQFRRRLKR